MCFKTNFQSTLALLLVATWVTIGAPQAPAAPLVDTDFAAATKTVNSTNDAGQSIKGVLPEGWGDRSGYQKDAQIRYERVTADGKDGWRATKIAGGEIQLWHPLPSDLPAGALFRLTVQGRNPNQMGVRFGVRDNAAPWNMYWSKSPNWGDEWTTWTADFSLPAKHDAYGLYIFASGKGAFDLGRLTLEQRTPADIIAQKLAQYPGGGPHNLMRHTRFPLGLQAGWSVETKDASLGEDAWVDADPKTIGPSGSPSLRVETGGKSLVLWSSPFDVAQLDARHTASFYVRGNGSGNFAVRADYGNTLGTVDWQVKPADGWKRVSVSFDPGIAPRVRALRWSINGDVRLDALQVEPNAQATAYEPPAPLEVAFAPGAGDAAEVRVHFNDEPAVLNYAIVGAVPAGARLVARVVDARGKSQTLPTVPAQSQGTLKYDVTPNEPLGAFRVEARVEDAAGKALSEWNEFVITRVHRPRYWNRDAPNSPFGVHMNPTRQNILLAKASGINWVRLHDAGSELLKWAYLEPERGQWQWNDAGIQRLRDGHIEILGVLQTTPKWASLGQQGDMSYYGQYFLPANADDWKNYVRQVTTHYKGVIGDWDVWNEPWGGGYLNEKLNPGGNGKAAFSKPADQTGAYLQLQREAYDAVQQSDPDARVLVDTTNSQWTTRTLKEEKADGRIADVLAFHSYPNSLLGTPGDSVSGGNANRLKLEADSVDAKRPLWMTEGSPVNDSLFSGIYNYTLPYESEENVVETSDDVARFMLSHLGSGVSKMFLYSMGKGNHFGRDTTRWAVGVMEDGAPHPSVAAHSALAYLLEDTRHVKNLEVAPGVFAYLFEGQNRAVAALSTAAKHDPYTLPALNGVQVMDLFGNPLTGAVEVKDDVIYLETSGTAAQLENLLGGKEVAP